MTAYVLRRLLLGALTFLLITVVSFCVIHLAPGEPFPDAGEGGVGGLTAKQIEKTRAHFHLDEPLHVQYALWLRRVLVLDFGRSFADGRPVTEKVAAALRITLFLSVTAISLDYLLAIPLGIWAAVRHGKLADRGISLFVLLLYSLPNFWVATLLLIYLAGGRYLDWFPPAWLTSPEPSAYPMGFWLVDRIWHLILPVACLSYASLAGLSRYMRASMLEVIRQDYIRTARAKGLSERVVVLKHALRNSLIPIVTLLAHFLPALIGGSVIVETIFSLPGMGQVAFSAITARDYPVVMATLTFSAFLTLAGFLIADVLYVVVDPRISFEGGKR